MQGGEIGFLTGTDTRSQQATKAERLRAVGVGARLGWARREARAYYHRSGCSLSEMLRELVRTDQRAHQMDAHSAVEFEYV